MFKKFVLIGAIVIISLIVVENVSCRSIESMESMEGDGSTSSSEPPMMRTPRTRHLDSAFPLSGDAIFGFINQLINTGYASSKIALSRLEKATNKRREIEDHFESILEAIPSYTKKIPVLDDLPQI